jgi:hypothetical protein
MIIGVFSAVSVGHCVLWLWVREDACRRLRSRTGLHGHMLGGQILSRL